MKFEKSDDALLIRLIAKAERGALEELYDRYNRLVFSVALAIVSDRSIAEEVTLDVFVRVWQGASTYHPERANVRTWLAAITRHHSIDILRGQRSRLDQKSLYLDELSWQEEADMPDPQEGVEMNSQHAHIRQAMAQLPADQRETLLLAYFKGYSHRQIAELLEAPLGTIKTRIRLAMQKLRQILSEEPQPSDKSDSG
jgi:RNA polymerase sigma-70 factor (ECF subfamily)